MNATTLPGAPHVPSAEPAPAVPRADDAGSRAEPLPPVAYTVGRSINRLRTAFLDTLDRDLAQYDISAAQLIVLAMLANGDADSAAGLCRTISYDPGAMTRMVDRLEQKGLIRRRANPDDRRTMNLELTSAGRALYPTLAAAKEAVHRRFLAGFTAAEVSQLDGFLRRMLENR